MDAASTKVPRDLLYCLGGLLAGYVVFALLHFWLENEFWGTAIFAFVLHAPVFIIYIAILLFLHRRWPHIISRAALVVCGIAVGLFPLLGVAPIWWWRLQYAIIILAIQITSLVVLAVATYFTVRLSRRLHKT